MLKKVLPLLVVGFVLMAPAAEASTLKEKVKSVVSTMLMPVRITTEAVGLITAETAKLVFKTVDLMDPASDTGVQLVVDFQPYSKD